MITEQQFFELVKKLLNKRTGRSSSVDDLDRSLLSGTPEAMIVTVWTNVFAAQAKGLHLWQIIQECEQGRRQLGYDDDLFNKIINVARQPEGGVAVEFYCHYRFRLEFPEDIQNSVDVKEVIEGTIAGLFPKASSNTSAKKPIKKKAPVKKAVAKKTPVKKIVVNKAAINAVVKKAAAKAAAKKKSVKKVRTVKKTIERNKAPESKNEIDWEALVYIALFGWIVFVLFF